MSSLSSQAQAVESGDLNSSDGAPLDTSNVTIIVNVLSANESATVSLTTHQSLMMCELSPDSSTVAEWIASLPVSPVNRSREQESSWEQTTDEISGQILFASLEKCSQDMHSWKMCRTSSAVDTLQKFLKTFPRSGIMRDGKLFQLKKSELHTSENDCGYLLPTPTASSYGNNQGGSKTSGKIRHSLTSLAAKNLWPTPVASDAKRCGQRTKMNGKRGETLDAAAGGPLSPMWVEWLMGWPIGSTDLKPLEMAKFQEWLKQHGKD